MSKGIRTLSVLLLGAIACASQASSTSSAGDADAVPRPGTQRPNRNVITLGELSPQAIRAMNVLDVVRSLRPTYLNERGQSSQSNPAAGRVRASLNYNGVIQLNDLRKVPIVNVIEIRYLDVATAMNRFGDAANEGPVILVLTHCASSEFFYSPLSSGTLDWDGRGGIGCRHVGTALPGEMARPIGAPAHVEMRAAFE